MCILVKTFTYTYSYRTILVIQTPNLNSRYFF